MEHDTDPAAARPSMAPAAFAIPGDIETKTGGFIYERQLLLALRASGRAVAHLALPAGFPDPSPAETGQAVARMAAVPAGTPLIVDGLVFGSIETAGLDRVRAPLVAMIHHPLALEAGLSEARAAELFGRERDNLARAARVVVPSRHTAAILTTRYGVAPDRIAVASPGFPPPDPVRLPSTVPRILSVGILAPRKGHDVLLDALDRVRDLDWTADIVGAPHFPETARALEARLAELNLRARVRFAGLVSEDALRTHYRRASLFALATRYEGYGMAFGEALLHGLPIVSCRVGAVPDTVPRGTGLLVAPHDARAFADALRRLLTDAPLRASMAEAATQAGGRLPRWAEAAGVMNAALDAARTLRS